mmetsp:Transcript_31668/g.38791  ORF Transcript_31668/g.38791 Transcript_31668/m.38791 type:complete len:366 (+) Transcript_31668:131-1228(+)|eukprot:CAMPEP_0172513418 /NCGR_PEP_ID=MMETSP1066-20121228/252402_1 /TAXON_ID=671091 /ORGANISM="Coscinodiscus wailesii, Strain CCMP2513" /LENGTH=365 /DNA_ID=CAMNT_0013293675 /DNA_START=113 /DNA_END=1210 /DNA_ORIENTATION=-
MVSLNSERKDKTPVFLSIFLLPAKYRLVGLATLLLLGVTITNYMYDDTSYTEYHKTKVIIKKTKPSPPASTIDEDIIEMTPNDDFYDEPMEDFGPVTYDDDVIKMEDDMVSPEYYVALFRDSIIESYISEISEPRAIRDASTPQGKAKKWIIDIDKRNLHPDDPFLLQRYALAVLFYATAGENWHHGNMHWLSGVHECFWSKKVKGVPMGVVECDSNRFVTRIQLVGNNLQGTLPKEIGAMERLVSLDLQENRLSGTIPSSIGDIKTLENLFVNSNQLKGTVPTEMGQLQNLGLLLLDDNELTGSIPLEVCMLKSKGWISSLWADCDGTPKPPIECACCSMCCDGLGYCLAADGILEDLVDDFVV